MQEIIKAIAQWLAPLLSAAISAYIAVIQHNGESKRDEARADADEKRAAEAQWRKELMSRMDSQDKKIELLVLAQATDMRSDIIHKCHRYLDDLGMASVEEKDALKAHHKEYKKFCKTNEIENDFIDVMVQRVMDLPERSKTTEVEV